MVADELFWRLRLAMSQCRHSRWRVLCVSPVTDQWVISGEERSKHDMLFVQQNPVGGYLSGMIAVFTCFTDNLIVIIIDVFYFLCYLPTSQSLVSPVSTVSIEFVSLSAVLCWALISHSVFPTWCYAQTDTTQWHRLRPMPLCGVSLSRSRISSKWVNISSKHFHCRAARPFWFFHTRRHGNISMGTPPMRVSNASGVIRNCDSEPIFGSVTCCERQVQCTQLRRTMASWWRELLVNGRVCWWRETTMKWMTRSLIIMLKRTEQYLIVHSGKPESYVSISNKRLHSRYHTESVEPAADWTEKNTSDVCLSPRTETFLFNRAYTI